MFRTIGRLLIAPVRLAVRLLIAGLDWMTGLVARLLVRFDAHYESSTRLLRARYARRTDLSVNPPPSVAGVADRADLAIGSDIKVAA